MNYSAYYKKNGITSFGIKSNDKEDAILKIKRVINYKFDLNEEVTIILEDLYTHSIDKFKYYSQGTERDYYQIFSND